MCLRAGIKKNYGTLRLSVIFIQEAFRCGKGRVKTATNLFDFRAILPRIDTLLAKTYHNPRPKPNPGPAHS